MTRLETYSSKVPFSRSSLHRCCLNYENQGSEGGGGFGKRPARKRSGRASLLILFDRWKNTFSFLSSILTFHPLHILFQTYILCYKGISNQLDKHLKVKSGSNNFFLKYFINAVCFTPSLDRHCSNFWRIKLIIPVCSICRYNHRKLRPWNRYLEA